MAEDGWEYAEADTQYHVHGLHPYPARMIPQVANRLIRTYSEVGQTVLDPFCGSGGVLVESLLLERKAKGVDVNPLAHLLARVKTTPIAPEALRSVVGSLLGLIITRVGEAERGLYKPSIPYFRNIYHWFKRKVVRDLAIIREAIEEVANKNGSEEVYNFLRACFSATLRRVSNIAMNDNPYFIRALMGEELERHEPSVLDTFQDQVDDAVVRMDEFYRVCPTNASAKVLLADTRELPLGGESADLIVTSPPYGEESHTMSYTRFSKLSLLWLGYDPRSLNLHARMTLGGELVQPRSLSSPTLEATYARVKAKNPVRAKEMFSYFYDYSKCLYHMYRVLRPGGYCCIVIGDRSVTGIPVSNENITIELGRGMGFRHVVTHYRAIPKKVLPRRDYKVDLINRESIIILRKD